MRRLNAALTDNATTKTRKHEKDIGFLRVFVLSWLPSTTSRTSLRLSAVSASNVICPASGARTAQAEDGLRTGVHILLSCRDELGGAAPSAKQEPSVDHVRIAAVAGRQRRKR